MTDQCSTTQTPSRTAKLKIAMIGTRGVPACYGGFETCVEEIGKRLAARGHEVAVYCRSSYYEERLTSYLGMKLICLPSLGIKSLDTLSHTALSVMHAILQGYDVFMVFNAANSFALIPLLFAGKKTAINTDGLEWKRSKWGWLGKNYYKLAERMSCLIANRIVADSKGIHDYYLAKHKTDSSVIAYGAYIHANEPPNLISSRGLQRDSYFLQITRFEPENHPLLTIQAFRKLNTGKKLVLVGGVPYPGRYHQQIRELANQDVLLLEPTYEPAVLKELWSNCFAYIHGNSVGGTNPALLQAMASGCFVLSYDVTFNRDVLGEFGIYYDDVDSLARQMVWSLENEDKRAALQEKARQRIKERYSWERVTDQYEELFYDMVGGR